MENYSKLRVIGKGSYGEVWLVKHKKDRKQYVLKKLDVHNASKRERHAAEQEAKLLSKLKHPNIVSYKDSFETDEGHLYIAMGYCEGGDLYARLKEQKSSPLDERQIVEWFVQIAMALQYMHERNILHRDLKTQNIFLTKSKIIKVGDLGIARVLDCSSDMATTLIGTPYYMSPELFSNKPYNHKSDVWALGCCVYEMTTLKHAFNAKDMNSLVYKILRGKMPNMPKQYSHDLVNLIKAMLNHNPDRRPSVSRILRDAYIKQNIALFLESSKREKERDRRPSRTSASDSSETESKRKEGKDVPDGAMEKKPRKSTRPTPAIVVKEEDVEPLQVGPELAPIVEEELDGTAESRKSHKKMERPRSSPSPSSRDRRSERSSEGRAFKPHGNSEPVMVAVESSPANSLKSSGNPHKEARDPSPLGSNKRERNSSPSNKHKHSDRNSWERSGSDSRPGSASGNGRPRSGHRPNSRERDKDKISPSSSSSSLSSKEKSPESRRREKKSVSNSAQPLPQSRPLPNRDPTAVTPRESSNEPKSSKSSRIAGRNVESGYGSALSAASQEEGAKRRVSEPNLSARERRRERKDRETPRDPISARSVDLNRRSLEQESKRPQLARPANSRSEDFDKGSDNNIRPRSAEYKSASKAVLRDSKPKPKGSTEAKSQMRQPSMEIESSSSSSGEELMEVTEQKENKRKEKEMNNFISLLNTTLQMNKKASVGSGGNAEEEEDEDDEDDIFSDDVDLAPPGGTRFIRRAPRPQAEVKQPGAGDRRGRHGEEEIILPVLEVESIQGTPKFNVNVSSPGKAEMRTLTTTGRLWARITDLRKDCIRGLGVEKIKRAYEILDNFDAEELEPQLVQLLGKGNFDLYAGKIWQLKFCEEAAFGLL